jgi:protein-disulfide isomerase
MKNVKVIVVVLCLSVGYSIAASAESRVESDIGSVPAEQEVDSSLGAEYEKLLRMMQEKRKPVQTIDGALGIAGRPGIGPKDAEVILVEFGDFQCPFCRRHLQGTAQQIYDKLVATHRLRYVFLDFPIEVKHPLAAKAAAAGRCAEEQGKYWEMRNILYKNQKALHEVFLVEHAKTAGMDEASFTSCLESGRYDAAIRQDQIVGKSLGIKGTPTFFLGINNGDEITLTRKIVGTQPYEIFEREFLRTGEVAAKQRGMRFSVSQTGTSGDSGDTPN